MLPEMTKRQRQQQQNPNNNLLVNYKFGRQKKDPETLHDMV